MTSLADQLRMEDDMVLQGADRFMSSVKTAETKERSSDTGYANVLMRRLVKPVSDALAATQTGRASRAGKYRKLLKDMDPDVVAYIGIKTLLNCLHSSPTATAVCMEIGSAIEDELRFSQFREQHPQYFEVLMADFKRRGTRSYRHLRNALSITSQRKGVEWESWATVIRLNIGSLVLDAILAATDLAELKHRKSKSKGKKTYTVEPTASAVGWISQYNSTTALLHPVTKPCIMEPDNWSGIFNGGYWSEQMRNRVPFVTGMRKNTQAFLEKHDLSKCYTAVNAIQATRWRVNTKVLEVMEYCWDQGITSVLPSKEPTFIPQFKVATPPKEMDPETFKEFIVWKAEVAKLYTEDVKRGSKAYDVARVIRMARTYMAYPCVWFVHQCDFRGRVYASSTGLNPQGPDHTRSLLMFDEGKRLGDRGAYWLAVHGANCYGIDKVSFDERVIWAYDQWDKVIAVYKDPIENRAFWQEADSPWQYLAWCLEFGRLLTEYRDNPSDFVSHLPVGMDGSCNGLQNFSALLRDHVGGAATNLVPGDKPADIYTEVAKRALLTITEAEDSDHRTYWLKFAERHNGIPRSIAKRPVMTLPYGSTKYACLDFIQDAVYELEPTFLDQTGGKITYLTDHVWEAIGTTVVSARDAMEWLQQMSLIMCKEGLPIWWVTPTGFPVYQERYKDASEQIRTCLMGSIKLRVTTELKELSARKQAQGVAPNFVHSLDAAHMITTVLGCIKRGITSFNMIHDSYATHAADVEVMREVIRNSFVDMYTENNPLEDLLSGCRLMHPTGKFPELPKLGNLDIELTRNSKYLFG